MKDANDPALRDRAGNWLAKNKLLVGIGGGVAVLIMVAEGEGESTQQPQSPVQMDGGGGEMGGPGTGPQGAQPDGWMGPQGGGLGPPDAMGPTAAPSGGVDMDEWRRREAASDESQRRRIEAIREEERCRNSDGTVDTVSIHTGC